MNELQMQQMLRQSTLLKCSCGNGTFISKNIIRKVSKLLNPTIPQDLFIPIQVMFCDKCDEILSDFLPEVLPNLEEELGLKKPTKPESVIKPFFT